jgi:hypothetical protein
MSLTDKLTAEKAGLESYLDSARGAKLEQSQIDRLDTLNSLLGIGTGGGGGSASNVTISSALPAGTNAIGSITNTTFAATQSGTWNIANISGTVSLPTGASTSALQTTGNNSLASIDSKLVASTQRTVGILSTSTSGTITAGARQFSIANIGNATGTVGGVNLLAGEVNSWTAPAGDTLSSLAYNATGTTFKITEVR